MRRFGWCVLASAMCLVFSGCAMMHDFRPHRMWRFNRGPAPSTNPFFSVSDPIPQLGQAAGPQASAGKPSEFPASDGQN